MFELLLLISTEAELGKALGADLAFIVDRSSPLSVKQIVAQYEFIKYLAIEYFISLEWAHFGVITADETAEAAIEFRDHYNIAGFNAAMDRLSTSVGAEFRLDLALGAAVNQLFTASAGMRSDKARLVQ